MPHFQKVYRWEEKDRNNRNIDFAPCILMAYFLFFGLWPLKINYVINKNHTDLFKII